MGTALKVGAGVSELRFPAAYFPSGEYDGIHDPMHCKALLLAQGAVRGGIVTLELPSIRPWELTDELRVFAADCLQAPYEQVWLVMTHDLSAPHVPQDETLRRMHMETLRTAVAEACSEAVRTLREATLAYGTATCDINVNRDEESADGWWVGIHGVGPSEKALTLLRFDDTNGKPIAALYSYALKSSVMEEAVMSDGKRLASAEVTGIADALAEADLACPVLFVMGAAGDQVPREKAHYLRLNAERHFEPVDLREDGWPLLDRLGGELKSAICAAFEDAVRVDAPALAFAHTQLRCPAKKPYPKALPKPPVLCYDYEADGEQTLDIWRLELGDIALLGLKPEVTTPIFAALQAQVPQRRLMMATLVNGGQGYVATDWDYPRYTYPGLNTPFQQGTDRLLIRHLAEALNAE